MLTMFLISLLSIVLVFILLSFFIARVAKKHGKNPWLWGSLTMIVVTALSWQHLPRWAGRVAMLQVTLIHSIPLLGQAATSASGVPNMINQYTLPAKEHTYTLSLPAVYQAEHPLDDVIRFASKYPTMEASPRQRLGEGVLDIVITTDRGHASRAQLFLDQVSANKVFGNYMGKQGKYDVFQRPNEVTGRTETTFIFTAKDGQLVLIEPEVFGHRIWRNIGSDISIDYGFFPEIGDDFIKIDEVVSGFINAHLASQPTKNKENTP